MLGVGREGGDRQTDRQRQTDRDRDRQRKALMVSNLALLVVVFRETARQT